MGSVYSSNSVQLFRSRGTEPTDNITEIQGNSLDVSHAILKQYASILLYKDIHSKNNYSVHTTLSNSNVDETVSYFHKF